MTTFTTWANAPATCPGGPCMTYPACICAATEQARALEARVAALEVLFIDLDARTPTRRTSPNHVFKGRKA